MPLSFEVVCYRWPKLTDTVLKIHWQKHKKIFIEALPIRAKEWTQPMPTNSRMVEYITLYSLCSFSGRLSRCNRNLYTLFCEVIFRIYSVEKSSYKNSTYTVLPSFKGREYGVLVWLSRLCV